MVFQNKSWRSKLVHMQPTSDVKFISDVTSINSTQSTPSFHQSQKRESLNDYLTQMLKRKRE